MSLPTKTLFFPRSIFFGACSILFSQVVVFYTYLCSLTSLEKMRWQFPHVERRGKQKKKCNPLSPTKHFVGCDVCCIVQSLWGSCVWSCSPWCGEQWTVTGGAGGPGVPPRPCGNPASCCTNSSSGFSKLKGELWSTVDGASLCFAGCISPPKEWRKILRWTMTFFLGFFKGG